MPFCNAQLAGFAAEKEALDGLGVRVVALSVDDEATSAATAAKNHLLFPVGHSANADAVRAATGAFVNPTPHYLQPAGFVLGPDGTVKAAVCATSAIGRMLAKDVVGFVGYLKSVAARPPPNSAHRPLIGRAPDWLVARLRTAQIIAYRRPGRPSHAVRREWSRGLRG